MTYLAAFCMLDALTNSLPPFPIQPIKVASRVPISQMSKLLPEATQP